MINVSNVFKEKLEAGEPVRMVVDITFPDGTKKTINEDIMNGDNGFSDCADSSSFPIGATVCKTLTLSINNDQEKWKNYNFYGAKIHAYLKLQTSYAAPESVSTLLDESYNPILDSTGDTIIATQAATKDIIETIDKGVYTVTTPEQYSDIINVTALDDMYKANKVYTSGLKLPQSLINLVRDACKTVGIGMNLTMEHGDIIIRSIPDSMTFRQLFGYAAMVESANARIDYFGNLQFVKWDFGKMESDNAATVDADGFIHFADANPSIDTNGFASLPGWAINAEGFLALTSGPGSDVQRLMAYANPPALSSDDIVITGIKVTNGQSNDDTETDYSGMYGEEGYVLELENELIDTDQLQTVANIIGEQIVGARFRNLEGDLVYNPLVEFGDMVYTYDRLGNKYVTPLTDVSGNVGGLTTVKTQADDPIRGSSDFYGNSTKAIVAARRMVQKETSAREEAIRRLAETLSSSSGLYMTQEPQQDGSIIYYMHNKATMAESNIIWKLTAEAFAVSIDGGKTYPYGFAVTGELITRLLYAEGINADYIDAGTLIVRDKNGNVIFEADMDTGSVTLDGSCVTIGGKTLSEKLDDVENAVSLARNMTIQLDNDYQGIPVDSDGNYTEFPECTTTATVMYGTQDITDNCTYTITTSQNIQGSWDKENKTYAVTGLTADSGWVNIKAAYLNNLVISKQFSLAKQYAGAQGEPGTAGRTYFFQSNADVLLMGADKKITPAPLIVDSFYRDGNGEVAQSQKGWWKLEKSTDNGATWSALTVSQTAALDRLSINVNNLSLKAHDMLKASLYFDQSKTKLADYQTYSVAVDVASLTQDQIVDILSDGGKFKGLYYGKDESGNTTLYISFNAAKGGTLALGGPNNGNGRMKIYDENGKEVLRLTNGGMALNSADNDAITIIKLLRSGMYFYDSTGNNRKMLLNTAGMALFTYYADADNYRALRFGKYGMYAVIKNDVQELPWMGNGTSEISNDKWEGYIVKYTEGNVRINANVIYTDKCSMGNDLTTKGSLSVAGAARLKGGAYVKGIFSFEDSEQTDERNPVRRRPIATLGTVGKKVAFIGCGQTPTGSTDLGTSYKNYLEIRGQFTGDANFVTDKFYSGSAPSDIRLKKNVKDSKTNALETVNRMKVRQFDWKKERGGWHQNIGFVADELEEIDPNLALGGGYDENGEMDIKQINSPYLLNYAIKAIQELSAKVDEQEKRIKELERRLQ